MWLDLLRMFGKGSPRVGTSFTTLQCGATPGRRRVFAPKEQVDQVSGIMYFLRHIARIG